LGFPGDLGLFNPGKSEGDQDSLYLIGRGAKLGILPYYPLLQQFGVVFCVHIDYLGMYIQRNSGTQIANSGLGFCHLCHHSAGSGAGLVSVDAVLHCRKQCAGFKKYPGNDADRRNHLDFDSLGVLGYQSGE